MLINIYISSSIKSPKRQGGAVGFVIEADGRPETARSQFGSVKDVTENQSELRALKYALKRIHDMSGGLAIWTECTYMSAAFERGWIKGWQERDWKTAKGKEVANRQEWNDVLELLGDNIPQFHIGEHHPYKRWLDSEVGRRAKDYV